ncbi:nectin-4 isoform X2 [Cololabis saira]|uniref:nectin-4 isoform X2 n=1 Tax=Cololabis saira TaxID=129043 RepID=UPI002AD575F7|nr:nectin-4 isoform X2 [Cololabis saira]
MDSRGEVMVLLLLSVSCVGGDFVEPREPVTSLRSLGDAQTRLPCVYKEEEGEKVVQVTWYKELPNGTKEQIITAHFQDGHTEFGRYSGRVRFENGNPTENSALLIPTTEASDEGRFTCHISTFPNGNFERHFILTVWVLPISSLDPVTLVEGQEFGVVASCRAVGRPLPQLSWDTDLQGLTQSRIGEGGTVTSLFSLHPLRSMNGKKLDCLVSHPGLKEPRRITNRVAVQYPPDATISASPGHWYVGLEEAELMCEVVGFPKPQNISWTRRGGALPNGVSVTEEKLIFGRALRMNDSGVYECAVRNSLGVGKAEFTLNIAEQSQRKSDAPVDNQLLIIIIGASAGAVVLGLVLVVLLVNSHHRRRNRKLERELNEKRDEISNLSRQNSFRRMNSVSTDPRVQPEDYVHFMDDNRIKNSQISLGLLHCKGSQSTLGRGWGPAGRVDELGRPVVWCDGEESLRGAEIDGEKEERSRALKLNLKGSNMSLDSGLPSSLTPLKPQQDDCVGPQESDQGHLQERDSPSEDDWAPTQSGREGHDDEESNSSCQISEALTNHFYYSKGLLRPKPHSNAILMTTKSQII